MFLLLPKNPRQPLGVLLSAVIDSVNLPVELHRDAVAADGLLGSGLIHGHLTLFPVCSNTRNLGSSQRWE